MKVDVSLVSAVLDWVLDRQAVAPTGATSLRSLMEDWQSIHLRSSDLSEAIEILVQRGDITLETRCDGLWIRRTKPAVEARSRYQRLRSVLNRILFRRSLKRVLQRCNGGYAGNNRRERPSPSAL